ncbi:IS3 family transposase [Paenibacillus sp. D2_2]|nr:IS3 family transposase [Paenibacillus sp. D2_2]WMT43470.1 IS3 family transposase [Paenibacillus sp. D2_2]
MKESLRRLIQGPNAAFGYRKLTTLLRRKYRLIINKKKTYRLCKEMGILHPQRELRNPVPRKLANNRIVNGPNQLWQMDIKYGYVSLASADIFTWPVSLTCLTGALSLITAERFVAQETFYVQSRKRCLSVESMNKSTS